MKRSPLVVFATLALAFGVSAPASAATANPHASCNGIGGSTETANGGPGARAAIAHEVKDVFAVEEGTTPGGVMSRFAQEHLESVEGCFG
jgi:hypothetical protein